MPTPLQTDPTETRLANESPRYVRLLSAFARIFDPDNAKWPVLVAGSLAVDQDYGKTGRALVSRNLFFQDFPQYRTTETELTYLTLRQRFSEQIDTYSAGVLAALSPKIDRVRDVALPDDSPIRSNLDANATQRWLARDSYREGVIDLLKALVRAQAGKASSSFTQFVEQVVFMKQVEPVIRTLTNGQVRKLTDEDRRLIHSAIKFYAFQLFGEVSASSKPRQDLRQAFRSIMTISDSNFAEVEILTTVLIGMGFDDPIPLHISDLTKLWLQNARKMISPLRESAQEERKRLASDRVRRQTPLEIKPTDQFAPSRPSQKISNLPKAEIERSESANIPAAARSSTVDPEFDLLAFGRTSDAMPLSRIRSDTVYQFIFQTEPEVIRRIRFSNNAINFMRANTNDGKKLIRSFAFGFSPRGKPGLTRNESNSPHWTGPIYILEMGGKYHPFVIERDGVFEVIEIAHTDDLERTARRIKPLKLD